MRNQYSTKMIVKSSVDLVQTANIIGRTIRIATAGTGTILYEFTVTARNKPRDSDEITLTGHVRYSGLMQVKAKIWIRVRDGKAVLGIDLRDLVQQETAARKATEDEPLRW